MSTQSLLGYDDIPSLHRAPSYTAEPLETEQRIAINDRSRPRPTGSFVKPSKHGHARLKLLAQEDGIAMPVYGLSGLVQGIVELDPEKAENVDSVEVKVLSIQCRNLVCADSLRLKVVYASTLQEK